MKNLIKLKNSCERVYQNNVKIFIKIQKLTVFTLSNISSGNQLINAIMSSGQYGGAYMISATSDLSQLQYAVETWTRA